MTVLATPPSEPPYKYLSSHPALTRGSDHIDNTTTPTPKRHQGSFHNPLTDPYSFKKDSPFYHYYSTLGPSKTKFWDSTATNQVKQIVSSDPLQIPGGPLTRAPTRRFKQALNGLIQDIWVKHIEQESMLKWVGRICLLGSLNSPI